MTHEHDRPTAPDLHELEFTLDELELLVGFIEASKTEHEHVRVLPSQRPARDSLERKLRALQARRERT